MIFRAASPKLIALAQLLSVHLAQRSGFSHLLFGSRRKQDAEALSDQEARLAQATRLDPANLITLPAILCATRRSPDRQSISAAGRIRASHFQLASNGLHHIVIRTISTCKQAFRLDPSSEEFKRMKCFFRAHFRTENHDQLLMKLICSQPRLL